ncbi:OmpA family protein [Ruegeria aquimaris]|uniref:OmpA family protein n=1 Tax=Ruegeria aquimaris TaxID=2984333 RepID=A0ABT3ARX6_9RHOB|nr:OmpA family protein [Ruegeria sp. XHP0148]MCV2891399.1 OmpA family protein [Ruegeria sp. XHP0148]
MQQDRPSLYCQEIQVGGIRKVDIMERRFPFLGAVAALFLLAVPAKAQSIDPFENGWILDSPASALRFMSVKKASIAENSGFANLSGVITPDGEARVVVQMDSVDTKIDLRNVRMRFLFFETFKFPETTITARLPSDQLMDLHQVRHKFIELPFTLNLHGITMDRTADVAVTLINNDRVAVANTIPIAIGLSEFGLDDGRAKLQEAANVDILPFGFVSFDFIFDCSTPGTPPKLEKVATPSPAAAALETKGVMDNEACNGRMEILSRTGSIYFRSGSARLDDASLPLLENLFDIVNRCPQLRIEIGGHTDSDGSNANNQALSEKRAEAVQAFLTGKGIASDRLIAVGYGEDRPVVPNTSAANKERNRRIEFVPR